MNLRVRENYISPEVPLKISEHHCKCIQPLKNGAARLDPWEIFVLLTLIPFRFISLRRLENYLQFYMTIAYKLNRTKKSSR